MKRFYLLGFLFFCASLAFGQDFQGLLDEMHLQFQAPKDSIRKDFVQQQDVTYLMAFSPPGNPSVEVRISLFPISYFKMESPLKEDDLMTVLSLFPYTCFLNMQQPSKGELEDAKFQLFKDEWVKNDFNADHGYSVFFSGKSDFSKGFKYQSVEVILSKKYGLVLLTILFNSLEDRVHLPQQYYYCFKFLE